jgi:RNA polymerase sigma factor (sigma-70 family)
MARLPVANHRTRGANAASVASLPSWFADELPAWIKIWAGCWRRIRSWRRPPHWSAADWHDEMLAQGAVVVWQALRDFDPARGVPLSAFVHQRVVAGARTLYRHEWAYALHINLNAGLEPYECLPDSSHVADDAYDAVQGALTKLAERDRELILQLYLNGWTEAEIAVNYGKSQGTINRRKHSILLDLRRSV